MGVLLRDVDPNRAVDGNDVSGAQSHMRQSVNNTNFRYDVNVSGLIDSGDVFLTRQNTGKSLP